MTRDPRLLRLLVWSYRRLLRLYPPPFRADYGGAMAQAFRDRCRAAHKARGLGGLLRDGAAGLLDAAANGVLERTGTPVLSGPDAVRPTVAYLPRAAHASDAFLREMRLAARRLVREPTFTIVVVSTLALGIGAATTIFSVVHGVLLQPLPYRDAGRVVTLWQWNQPKGIDEAPSPGNFLDWRDSSRSMDIAAAEPYGLDLTGSGDPIGLDTWRVSERFFDVLGVAPALGRTFLPEEHRSGRDRVVILSDRLWRTRFGSDPGMIGRSLILDRESFQVVGVLPARVDYPSNKDLWVPRVFTDRDRRARARTYYAVIGRLRPGVTLAKAREDMRRIGEQLAIAYPRVNKGVGVTVDPLFDRVTGPVRQLMLLLIAAVGCVLFIACTNAANLMLARAAARHAEIAVRRALGAGRLHLMRLTLAEGALLSLAAAAVGVLSSYWAVAGIVALAPSDVPRIDEVGLNVPVLAFAIVIAGATALACGLAPAVQFWRGDLESSLRAAGRSAGAAGGRFSRVLVGSQTAAAMILLIASGLLVRSFDALLKVDLGYRVDNRAALTMHVWDFYPAPATRAAFVDEAERRVAQQPGVLAVGAASTLPLSREGSEMDPPYTIAGQPVPQLGDEPTALTTFVTPGYFGAIGMRLVQGRVFSDRDTASAPPVVVVNETMARRAWPGENPIGKRIQSSLSFAGAAVREVVGVVGDVRQAGLQDRPQPAYYVPHRQVPFGSMTFIVRTSGDPARVVPSIQRAIWSLNPAVSFSGIETLNSLLRDTLAARRFTLTLLSAFSLVAVVLAAVGLYGLVSFSVSARTSEIGIRLALGAGTDAVIGLVMRQGMTIALSGLAAGVAASFVLTRYLTTMLFGVTATDPITYALLGAAVALVSAAACYVPARRATRVDPLVAIRV
jgi:putative ABC transport system permease protein